MNDYTYRYWKTVYLLFGDNFCLDEWIKYDGFIGNRYNSKIYLTWGRCDIGNYYMEMRPNGIGKFTKLFWEKLKEEEND